MKVILQADIKGVGKKDQIINANDGYARNFLFPKKLAVPADRENMTKLESKKASQDHKKELEIEEAENIRKKLQEITLKIFAKTGDNGKLFGSITSKEITENLEKQYKIKIDKKKINLKEPIKEIGMTNVEIKLYEGIIAKVRIQIVEQTK